MALVAKKRMNQTWREALSLQAGERAPAVLARFDEALALGEAEHIAAYRALEACGLLAVVTLPGDPSDTLARAEEAQIEPDDATDEPPRPDSNAL